MSSRKNKINISSSSEDDENRYATITDEKKRKRMISNRESARRSRMKREQHIKDLNDQITHFTIKKSEIARKVDEIGQRFMAVDSENRILRTHGEELKRKLEFLEGMLALHSGSRNSTAARSVVESDDEDCFLRDILQDPSLVKPWMQPPYQSQTVGGIYQF